MCFFFSSRRRHTSLVSDWSSDVCSSDLPTGPSTTRGVTSWTDPSEAVALRRAVPGLTWSAYPRSEERRVGKECRSRWAPRQCKELMNSAPKKPRSSENRQETTEETGHDA